MIRSSSLLFLILTGVWADAIGQALLYSEPQKEALYGQSGRTWFNSLAIDGQGGLAAVGLASRGPNGGSDIYWVKLDKNGKEQAKRYLGRDKDDGAHQVLARPNGGFLLVGYSEQPNQGVVRRRYAGGRDGWLLWLAEDGKSQSELLLGGRGADELTDALPLIDGGWIVVGQADGKAWVVHIGADRKVLWQKHWAHPEGNAQIRSVAMIDDKIYLTGRVGQAGKSQGWLLGISLNGYRLLDRSFPTEVLSDGHKIIAADHHRLALVGEAYTNKKRLEGSWLLLDNQGRTLRAKQFGGRENDRFLAAARSFEGQWVLLGESHSYERGAREPKAWAVQLDAAGELLGEHYYGSKSFDTGKALVQQPNGRWLMAGHSGQKILSSGQAWIWRASDKAKPPKLTPEVRYEPLVYTNESSIAGSGDALAFLPMRLQWDSAGQVPKLWATIVHIDSGERWEQQLVAGYGPNPTWRACPLPLPNASRLGRERYEVQLYAGKQAVGTPHTVEVAFSYLSLPGLSLKVREVPGTFAPGRVGQLAFTIANESAQPLQGVQLLGTGTDCLPVNEAVPIGTLPPKSSLEYTAKLAVGTCEGEGLQRLSFQVVDESLANSATATLAISLSPTTGTIAEEEEEHGGLITWLSPNPDQFDYLELVWNRPEIQVQVKVISTGSVSKQDFCLSINGAPCPSGTKMDEVRMSGRGRSRTFSQTIRLQKGENILQAKLAQPSGTLSTEPIKVLYTEQQPNLHLLSIGIPSYDLAFTAEDARDFARVFQLGQEVLPVFQHVFIDTLTAEQKTTKTEILKSLRRIQYRYANQQIRPNDLLVLFISSHGLSTADGQFRIAASDYDNPFLEETSLDFETEIIDYLKAIPCRKLIFIDACHSGAAGSGQEGGDLSSASMLASLAESSSDISMLLSCRADEYSYEDSKWSNGAFTEALVSSVETFRTTPSKIDQNGDQQLSLKEWYTYLGGEIERLIAQKRPRPKSGQHPMLHLSESESDVILLQIKP